jgi:diguanylate cyclase (GGDEF)-like protein
MLKLQDELLHRNIEYQKTNAKLAALTRKLEELANTDELTGLMNRRCTFERLEETWSLAERDHAPLSCIMIDVDRFKEVNDTYGHQMGDQVLRDIASTVRPEIRRPDLFGRVGGEEFVLICPSTPRAGAVIVAERIRQCVANLTTVIDDTQMKVTISCGVAERDANIARPDDLIRMADQLLYRAKESGRNQTWMQNADGEPEPVISAVAAK